MASPTRLTCALRPLIHADRFRTRTQPDGPLSSLLFPYFGVGDCQGEEPALGVGVLKEPAQIWIMKESREPIRSQWTGQMGLITRRSQVQILPPPPLKRWSAPLVHRAQAPDQRFRVRTSVWNCRFSGLFIGTYSAVPYAALCSVAPRTRPVRCGFVIESPVGMAAHRAARGMPYADGLLKVSRPLAS
jgi:hypothetical protein